MGNSTNKTLNENVTTIEEETKNHPYGSAKYKKLIESYDLTKEDNNCTEILTKPINQGKYNICYSISAARSELYETCKSLPREKQQDFSNSVDNISINSTVLDRSFYDCYDFKNDIYSVQNIQSGDRSCVHHHLNQYKLHPFAVTTTEEFLSTMRKNKSAPTTSFKTDSSIIFASKDTPYSPVSTQQPKDIYHAMVVTKYEVWENELGQPSTLLHMSNSWGSKVAPEIVIDVDDHPECIDFARFPRENLNQSSPYEISLKISDDMRSLGLDGKYTVAIGGDNIAGTGIIESCVIGGDLIGECRRHV